MGLDCVTNYSGEAFGKTSSDEEYWSQMVEGLCGCCHSNLGQRVRQISGRKYSRYSWNSSGMEEWGRSPLQMQP